MVYRIVDLFSGMGGLSYGFHNNPNFEIALANDIDKDILEVYKLNYPNTIIKCNSIADLTEEYLLSLNPIDIIIGGPPCQSYSTSGRRNLDDRANLFLQYNRILKILQPKLFVYENVKGLLSMKDNNGQKLFDVICNSFKETGYDVQYQLVNMANYGVPQTRERIILVGTKDIEFQYPPPTHINKHITLEEALSDLPTPMESNYVCEPNNNFQTFIRKANERRVEDHTHSSHSTKLKELMELIPEGGNVKDIPEDKRPNSGFGNSYAKLWWSRPSTTITSNFGTPSSARCIHPRESRSLTTREGMRLQSFPDSFKLIGSRGKKHLMIGNAVPPLYSINLSKQVYDSLYND